MGQIKWYKRDPSAALNGMMELDLQERGAYNTVLDLIYSRDGNLPDDDGRYEEALHLLFKPLRLHGEWFRLEGSLQRLIDCLCCSRGASPEWDSVEFWGAVFDSVKPEKDCRTHDLPSLSYLTPKVSIFCSIWEIGQ